ncbi:TRAG family protein [Paenibacillus sp. YN15]|uniref:TRAG family protein n=1 Tax=Paenibacillus sp. YN15 TaxID=1742774 RepID=UPI0015EB5DF4|nr:TRAG family protein [Paenibacillus sp. YN15]
MVKAKQKLLLCGLLFVGGAVFNLFFTTALHGALSGATKTLALPSLGQSLTSLFTQKAHFLLFLCFQGITLLLAVLFFVTNSQPYQSKLKQVAPGIETPVPVGQHQHGSARWLRKEEMPRVFDSQILDLSHPFIQQLMQTGYDDLEFLQAVAKEESPSDPAPPEEYPEKEKND